MTESVDVRRESDDHLLIATRILALVIVPVLVAAFVILFGFPAHTKRLWAWTIHPNLASLIMGAAYLTGAWFFTRTILGGRWHRVAVGWLAVIPFTGLLGVATFIHWDKFNHDHVSFWAWLVLYTVTPLALPVLWWNNQRAAGDAPTVPNGDLPVALRALVAGCGALLLGAGAVIFINPKVAIPRWPWMMTPLTARTLASFASFLGVVWLAFAVIRQWSRLAIAFEATTLGLLMVVVAVVRGHDDLVSGVRSNVFFVLLGGAVAGSLAVLIWASSRYRAQ